MEYPIEFFKILFGPTSPLWVKIWVAWMMLVNTASIFFINKKLGRIVLATWMGNGGTMIILFSLTGYNRLLGLSHVLWWTPLVIYLWKIKDKKRISFIFKSWYWFLFSTIVVSLVIDYIDVVRYFLNI